MVYLDNAATTAQKPEAMLEAYNRALRELSVNAGRGSYAMARQASQVIESCRQKVLKLGKAEQYSVYFSPSATMSLNQIILGLKPDQYATVYVTPFEHNAVMRPLNALCQQTGCKWAVLPFDRDTWTLDRSKAEAMFLRNPPLAVFASMVSNVTGVVLPIAELTKLAHDCNARMVVDMAQAFCAVDADLTALDADAYVFAGHKTLYGPFGIAGMILKNNWRPDPGLFGGTGSDSLNLGMPGPEAGGYEPGSPNVPAIAALDAALSWIDENGIHNITEHELSLVNRMAGALDQMKSVQMYCPPEHLRSSIVAFNVDGYLSRDVGEILDDEFGIAVRTGYQCAPLIHDWLGTREAGGVVRASVGAFTTEQDVDALISALSTL